MIVDRTLEEDLSWLGLSVFAVGGRGRVLYLYMRRSELPGHNKTVFLAAKDTWVMSCILGAYQSPAIVFTHGYSIEVVSGAMERTPLPQSLVWLKSQSGQKAVIVTVQKTQSEVKGLNDVRRIKPEQLHVPITLSVRA